MATTMVRRFGWLQLFCCVVLVGRGREIVDDALEAKQSGIAGKMAVGCPEFRQECMPISLLYSARHLRPVAGPLPASHMN